MTFAKPFPLFLKHFYRLTPEQRTRTATHNRHCCSFISLNSVTCFGKYQTIIATILNSYFVYSPGGLKSKTGCLEKGMPLTPDFYRNRVGLFLNKKSFATWVVSCPIPEKYQNQNSVPKSVILISIDLRRFAYSKLCTILLRFAFFKNLQPFADFSPNTKFGLKVQHELQGL